MRALCPFCGCGCSLNLEVAGGKITGASPDNDDPISRGKPCIKGLVSHECLNVKRIKTPLIRQEGKLVPATWEQAFNAIRENFSKASPENIGFFASGSASNEANYLLQKFARQVLKSEVVDSSATLCHASTVEAFRRAYGVSAMPAFIDDIGDSDCIIIVGSDPHSDYPIAFNRVMKAKEKNAKVALIEDSYNFTSKFSDIDIKIDVGKFLPVLNYLAREIINNGEYQKGARYLNWFFDLEKAVQEYSLEFASRESHANKASLKELSELLRKSRRPVFLFGMSLVQHMMGTKNALAVCNLAILKNGKAISMRGKNNIQGCGDMGCLPKNESFLELLFSERIESAVIMDSNPAISFPELNKVHRILKKAFVVYISPFRNSMLKFSDVVLPCTTQFEESGTMTNAESRVRAFNSVIEPLYGKPRWEIAVGFFEHFGKKTRYREVWDITREIIRKVDRYSAVSFRKLFEEEGDFAEKEAKTMNLIPVEYTALEETRTKERPFLLTTKRIPWHFVSGEMTRRCKTLMNLSKEAVAYMSPYDMKKEGIGEGEAIRIKSEVGYVTTKAISNKKIKKGTVVLPFHFEKVKVNKLIPFCMDPFSKEPNLKIVDVSVVKIQK